MKLPKSPSEHPASLALRQDRYHLLARRLRNYQILAGVLLLLDVAVTTDLIVARRLTRVVPYVVEVDGYGQARSVGPVPEVTRNDRRVVRSLLADWIWNVRTVTSDRELQQTFLRRAQSYTAGKARTELESFLRDKRNPFDVVEEKTIAIHLESALPLGESEEEWEVAWVEEHRPHSGGGWEEKWRALVTLAWEPPDEEVLELNPLGLKVKILNWTRVGRNDKE